MQYIRQQHSLSTLHGEMERCPQVLKEDQSESSNNDDSDNKYNIIYVHSTPTDNTTMEPYNCNAPLLHWLISRTLSVALTFAPLSSSNNPNSISRSLRIQDAIWRGVNPSYMSVCTVDIEKRKRKRKFSQSGHSLHSLIGTSFSKSVI